MSSPDLHPRPVFSAARPHCRSPWSVCWRTAEWTGRLLASCCQWGQPSIWMGQPCTRRWRPSSSLRSMSMTWTLVSWSLSGINIVGQLFSIASMWVHLTVLTSRLLSHQYNCNSSEHRGSWNSTSGSGDHGDCLDLCGVTTCWYLPNCGHWLGSVSPTDLYSTREHHVFWSGNVWLFPHLLLSDRFRTMINVLGDALAAGIMAHVCRKDFEKAAASSTTPTPPTNYGSQRVRRGVFKQKTIKLFI